MSSIVSASEDSLNELELKKKKVLNNKCNYLKKIINDIDESFIVYHQSCCFFNVFIIYIQIIPINEKKVNKNALNIIKMFFEKQKRKFYEKYKMENRDEFDDFPNIKLFINETPPCFLSDKKEFKHLFDIELSKENGNYCAKLNNLISNLVRTGSGISLHYFNVPIYKNFSIYVPNQNMFYDLECTKNRPKESKNRPLSGKLFNASDKVSSSYKFGDTYSMKNGGRSNVFGDLNIKKDDDHVSTMLSIVRIEFTIDKNEHIPKLLTDIFNSKGVSPKDYFMI